jgi:hypothetical protein
MAKRTFAELVEQIKTYTGDRDDDETLSLMEDINDTLNNETDWQAKYNENDKAWRAKYKHRFETGNVDEPDETDEQDEQEKPITFDQLFK